MKCTQCNQEFVWQPRTEMKQRTLHFILLVAVLSGIGVGLQFLGVQIWPWFLCFTALFVLTQAMVKWGDYTFYRCPHCMHGMTIWPWTR